MTTLPRPLARTEVALGDLRTTPHRDPENLIRLVHRVAEARVVDEFEAEAVDCLAWSSTLTNIIDARHFIADAAVARLLDSVPDTRSTDLDRVEYAAAAAWIRSNRTLKGN